MQFLLCDFTPHPSRGGELNNSLLLYAELFQVVVGTVVDVEVDMSLDAGQLAGVGVLPEFPRTFIFHFRHIVMGYPIGIVVETVVGKVFLLEFEIGIEYGLHMVAVFDDVQPCENLALEIFNRQRVGLVLYVKNGRKVSFFEVHLLQEEGCLLTGRGLGAVEVVCSANEAVFTCLVEILLEILVYHIAALC